MLFIVFKNVQESEWPVCVETPEVVLSNIVAQDLLTKNTAAKLN